VSTGTVLARRGAHGSVDPGPRVDCPVRFGMVSGIGRDGLSGCRLVDRYGSFRM
jgi:hypothetical protein